MAFLSLYTHLIRSDSTSTSGWYWVGDSQTVNLSWNSSASLGPSRFTVQVCNLDGFQSALPATTSNADTSTLSGVNMIGVTPGMASLVTDGGIRWMRVTVAPANHSAESVATIWLNAFRRA